MRTRTAGAVLVLAVASLGAAHAAELVVAKVLAVEGKELTISAGSASGIAAGQVFTVASLEKGLRLSLGAADAAPAGGALAKVVSAEAEKAVIEITAAAEGFEAAAGMVAVAVVGEMQAAPAGPEGFALEVSRSSAGPGDDVVVTASAHGPGVWYEWSADGGVLSQSATGAPKVLWTAPRAAAKVKLACTRHAAGGEAETDTVEVEATGVAAPLPEKVVIERALGSRRFDEPISAGHRIADVAFDDSGVLYILDSKTRKVYSMDDFGASAVIFPREQSGAQMLLGPVAVTVSRGKLYVADASAKMIKLYSAARGDGGKFLRTIGAGEPISRLEDITSDTRGYIYALDSGRRCLHVFAPDGSYVRNLGRKGAGAGEFLRPVALDCDLEGNLYVLDTGRKDVQSFDSNLAVKSSVAVEVKGAGDPVDIAIRPADGAVLVLHGEPSPAVIAYKGGKAVWSSLEKMVLFPGLPEQPNRIAIDAAGTVMITPRGRRRIHRYDAEARAAGILSDVAPVTRSLAVSAAGRALGVAGRKPLLRVWDTEWWLRQEFLDPGDEDAVARSLSRAVATGDGKLLCALDPSILSVLCFNFGGELVKTLGGKAEGRRAPPERLQSATDLAPAKGPAVAVLDARGFRVVTYDTTGEAVAVRKLPRGKAPSQVSSPSRIAVDTATDDLYVYDRRERKIKKFASDGRFIGAIGGPGTEPGRFSQVERMVVGTRGELWVFDSGRRDVQRIDFRTEKAEHTFTIAREPFDANIADIGVDGCGRLYVLTERDTVYVFGQH